MSLHKQAKILTDAQAKTALTYLGGRRHPERDRVMFLLSVKAGLRAVEIAALEWAMVTDGEGEVADAIALRNVASKGKNGGRTIPLNRDLWRALEALHKIRRPGPYVARSERGLRMSAGSVTCWFQRLYGELGFVGCSSHSGRRTFVTKAAHKVVEAGGSLRDVQQLAGHASLATTQRYIEGNSDAKRKLVNLI